MLPSKHLAALAAMNPEALTADGFDAAMIGVTANGPYRAVYSYEKCVRIQMDRTGSRQEDAIDFVEFNVVGAHLGENGPLFVSTEC